jgi:hypothetical protein
LLAACFISLHFKPEDGDGIFLRNARYDISEDSKLLDTYIEENILWH